MSKTLAQFIAGQISDKEKVESIIESGIILNSERKRFEYFCKLSWIYWTTQEWNSNFTKISFEKYLEGNKHLLDYNNLAISPVEYWIKYNGILKQED